MQCLCSANARNQLLVYTLHLCSILCAHSTLWTGVYVHTCFMKLFLWQLKLIVLCIHISIPSRLPPGLVQWTSFNALHWLTPQVL